MQAHIYVLGLHSAKGNCLFHRKISLFRCIFLMCKMPKRENYSSYINPITPGVHKMVKHVKNLEANAVRFSKCALPFFGHQALWG